MECQNKRIAFVIGNMQRDGAERVISILAEHYCQNCWNVDILTLLNNRCDYKLNPQINIIPVCREYKSYYRNILFWIKGIRNYVKLKNPTKIVSFVARINILTLAACLGLKKSITISERNDPASDGRNVFVKLATYILYNLADGIVFQTKWARSCFPNRIKNKSFIIPNPVKVSVCSSNIKKKKIVAVGRLESQKNHTMLVDAFKKVHDIYPEYKLYIYGEGELRDALALQIQKLGIEESIFLPGNVSDVHEKIADAEMFVLSSNYEGLSNALLEAMMMGLPCISTNCAGSNEVITNNYNGVLVDIGNTEQLFNSMVELIEDKEKAYRLSKNGKRSVQYMKYDYIVLKWQIVIENIN